MRIMIATPCLAKQDTPFVQSLFAMLVNPIRGAEIQMYFSEGSLTYDSRNRIADDAIKGNFDRVLWVDSDMVFDPSVIHRLNARLDEGREFVAALAFRRKPPYKPVIYSDMGIIKDETGREKPYLTTYEPYPKDQLFEIAGAGFGCVMTSVKLLKDCRDKFGLPFSPRLGFGEDVTFCLECRDLGRKMYCDSSVKVGHIGTIIVNEEVYDAQIQHNHPGT